MKENVEIRQKLQSFCAAKERCTSEVIRKLTLLGADTALSESIILHLKEHKYLDDKRYCLNFVRQSYEEKKRGRVRMLEELKMRGLEDGLIEEALNTLSREDFDNLLLGKIRKETRDMNPEEIALSSGKIIRKMLRDGFEEEDISRIFHTHFIVEL